MIKLQATDQIVNFDKPNAYQAAVRAHAAKMEEWAAYVRAKSEELDHAAEAMTCPPGVKMNNLDHGDAEKIKEWSMQISAMQSQSRAFSVKIREMIREMEAKLRAQQEAQQEAQDKESDLRIEGRSTLWLKVNDGRHSLCKVQQLSRLDWSRWFADIKEGRLCLYVCGPEDALHLVHCRKSETPRLAYEDGELWWIVYE